MLFFASGNSNAPTTRKGLLVASALSMAAVTWWWQHQRRKDSVQKPPIQYEHPPVPPLVRILAALPASMRRSMILKGAKPHPPLDCVDVGLGQPPNPYTELGTELVPDKIWRVRYRHVLDGEVDAMMKLVFGTDLADPTLVERAPEALQAALKQAQTERVEIHAKTKGLRTKEEKAKAYIEAGFEGNHDMLVVRLEATGGLLLYNPCRLHKPLLEWLRSKGPVEYIVSGSCSHTNQLPQAARAFPDAKIIASQVANDKCDTVGMRPADYIYTDPDSLVKASAALTQASNQHIRLFHVQGDTFTQTLCLTAYDHLLEVDLGCYGNGTRSLWVSDTGWKNLSQAHPHYQKHFAFVQLLHYAAIHVGKQAGYLPNFRLMGMDPTSPMMKIMCLEPPANDGSSCRQMAASLRQLLEAQDYHYVDSGHSSLPASLPADEYKQAVNGMWQWLDGKSLLVGEK